MPTAAPAAIMRAGTAKTPFWSTTGAIMRSRLPIATCSSRAGTATSPHSTRSHGARRIWRRTIISGDSSATDCFGASPLRTKTRRRSRSSITPSICAIAISPTTMRPKARSGVGMRSSAPAASCSKAANTAHTCWATRSSGSRVRATTATTLGMRPLFGAMPYSICTTPPRPRKPSSATARPDAGSCFLSTTISFSWKAVSPRTANTGIFSAR
jgi:hypothetical protein